MDTFDYRNATPEALMLEITRLSNLEYQVKRNSNILQPSCDNVSNVKRTEGRVSFNLRTITLIAVYICRLKQMYAVMEKRRKATGRVEKQKLINEKHLRITLMSVKRSPIYQFYMKYLSQKDLEMSQLLDIHQQEQQQQQQQATQIEQKVIASVVVPLAVPEE